ncbi:putative amino acid/polyamine transporter I [Cavenderia fasciculata]|uniref:Amino acid/polyamine transporter I n=1 Tax=Cavenderia fasciculata TaxID=261658 RepID=F4PV38_CACFS|nr:putative amino acid/polyamine transporter I [Cavenderia fasciculata]EGG21154.1 putative amino acid/polyamine transporter I [Cavenderia fasciculata]|eukprot:XP_004359004.1 putative amino acid/polyamine transporter I [Cavenderia fasciculata]
MISNNNNDNNNSTNNTNTSIDNGGDSIHHDDNKLEYEPLLINRHPHPHSKQGNVSYDMDDFKNQIGYKQQQEDGIYQNSNLSTPVSIKSTTSLAPGQLKKNALGLVHCLGCSISGVGPTCGIFLVCPQIAKVAGPQVPFTLILAAICCLSMASTISTFGKYIYSSASFYQYVSEGLGGLVGFITGWIMLVAYGILSVQTIIQFSSWTSDVIRTNTGFDLPWIVCGIVAIGIISSLAFIGINPVLKISLILVLCETIITFVLTVVIVAKGGAEGNYPLAFTPVGGSVSGMARGLVFSILVFVGFETAAILGAETRNPTKIIPQAVVGSVLITAIWLVWGMYAIIVACGPSQAYNLYSVSAPIDLFAREYVGRWFAVFIDLAGISTTFNVSTVAFNNMYRILYSVGKAKLSTTSNKLGITSKRFKTPVVAIVCFSVFQIISIGIVAAIFGNHTEGSWLAYSYLSYVGTIPLIIVFIITNIAVIPYMTNNHRDQFSYFYNMALPIFSAVLFSLVLFGNFYPDVPTPPNSYLLIALMAILLFGIALGFYLKRIPGFFKTMLHHISDDGNTSMNHHPEEVVEEEQEKFKHIDEKDEIIRADLPIN